MAMNNRGMKGFISAKIIAVLLIIVSVPQVSCSNSVGSEASNDENDQSNEEIIYHERALAVYDKIVRYFYVDEHNLFRENFPALSGDLEVSYLWPYFGLAGGVNTLIELGYDSEPFLNIINRFDIYFDDSDQPVAYGAYPPDLGASTHFYDDNAVVGLELIRAYEITGEATYLQKAEEIMPFLYTGETDRCGGGGIAWNENYIANPNDPNAIIGMSSSGYTALLALKLYQITGNEEYFDFGIRIYNWLKTNLKNPADNIYWNDVHMTTCEVNRDLYTYNTGVMMQVEIALYEITENGNHLQEAKHLANGAYTVFTRIHEGNRFFPARDPWFHAKLLQGYLDLYKYDESASAFVKIFIDNANHAWEHARNDINLFYEDWTGNEPGRDEWLLNQASVLEVFGLIALYKNESVY
jgi:hypothetical protein